MLLGQPSRMHPRDHGREGTLAIVEVAVASLLTPVLWQGFKRFTSLGHQEVSAGLNFSPGVVTTLVALCLFLWHRKSFAGYGVSLRNWQEQLKVGIILSLVGMLIGLSARYLFVRYHGNLQSPYGTGQSPWLSDTVISIIIVAIFPWLLKFSQRASVAIPTLVAILVLLGLWMTPLGLAWHQHRPVIHVSLQVFGLIVATGFAEEFLYRGYIQPRLNEVLGRPWCFGGIQFGWGLIITAVLFGFIHTLNGVDFLHGHFNLNWGFGLVVFVGGLWRGLLREGTGSIWAGVIQHGISDIWLLVVVPMMFD